MLTFTSTSIQSTTDGSNQHLFFLFLHHNTEVAICHFFILILNNFWLQIHWIKLLKSWSELLLKEICRSLAKHQHHFGEKGVWLDSQITFHERAVIESDVSTKLENWTHTRPKSMCRNCSNISRHSYSTCDLSLHVAIKQRIWNGADAVLINYRNGGKT